FTLVEMGAGTGQVAADLCAYFEQHYPQLFANLHYRIIEQAPALKIRQQQTLESWRDRLSLSWNSWAEIADHSLIGCCFPMN
ncbi:MAG: class I SAM-dependent methyltransferase, partial [Chloroflexaceae bacterium]|nr:class I SAM-dependent methyltransferase [Chloroflexaceae bacterium]